MTDVAWAMLALTGVFAVVDWWAVGTRRRTVEVVFKPATLVALIAVAVALEPSDEAVRAWFVAALALSLAGDVFLLVDRWFVAGLGSFLLGHVAYVVGFWVGGIEFAPLLVGVLLVAIALATLGRRIVRGVRAGDEPELVGPVSAYMVVISVMVASAFGYGSAWAVVGSILFYASDALIAWNRFIQEYPWGRLAIIVTYHAGQVGLVLSLTS